MLGRWKWECQICGRVEIEGEWRYTNTSRVMPKCECGREAWEPICVAWCPVGCLYIEDEA